jgi:hypothetical protein
VVTRRNYSAEILEALGKHDAAAGLRWNEPSPEAEHLTRIAALEVEVEQLRGELAHADEMEKTCPKCRARKADAS